MKAGLLASNLKHDLVAEKKNLWETFCLQFPQSFWEGWQFKLSSPIWLKIFFQNYIQFNKTKDTLYLNFVKCFFAQVIGWSCQQLWLQFVKYGCFIDYCYIIFRYLHDFKLMKSNGIFFMFSSIRFNKQT